MSIPLLFAYGLLWVVVTVETVVLCSLAQRIFGLGSALIAQVASDGPRLGTEMPRLTGTDTQGGSYEFGGSGERYRAVLFLSPACGSCRLATMWLGSFMHRPTYSGHVVVSAGEQGARDFSAEFQVAEPLIPDPGNRISRRYRVASSPYLVVLDRNGRVIGKGFVNSFRDVGDTVRIAQMRESMGGVPVRERTVAHVV